MKVKSQGLTSNTSCIYWNPYHFLECKCAIIYEHVQSLQMESRYLTIWIRIPKERYVQVTAEMH